MQIARLIPMFLAVGLIVSARTPTQEGLVFGQAEGETLTMDYYAAVGPGVHPAVILIHGGGYQRGNSKSGSEKYPPCSE